MMSTVFSFLLFLLFSDSRCRTDRVHDICSGRRVFLDLGESGVLTGFNVTPAFRNSSFHESCRVDIVTCSFCIVSLNFKSLNLSCDCGVGCSLFFHDPPRCDHVWVSEPPYKDASGVPFFRVFTSSGKQEKSLQYKSKTRTVRIWLFYTKSHARAFTLNYKSERNRQIFFGTSPENPRTETNLSGGVISSPFFPALYPLYSIVEYVLTCKKRSDHSLSKMQLTDVDAKCRVHLTFTDFQLADASVVEFYDGSHLIGVTNGTSFRPPSMLSKTNSFTVRFRSSGRTNTGFKAVFSFVSERNAARSFEKADTDCGGNVYNFGGTITMEKMVESQVKLFDCIWLIRPPKPDSNIKSHLYIKISAFSGFAGDAELQIRRGLTSESPALEVLRHFVSQNFQEHVISLRIGSYVRLKAFFGPATRFALIYSSFSHKDCFTFPGFLCKNLRCVAKKLMCDGFDHCGYNSHESLACIQEFESSSENAGNGKPGIQFSDRYFPKLMDLSIVRAASMFFLMSLAGLMFLASSLVVALFRMSSKTRRRRDDEELQSVGDLRDCLSVELSMEDVVFEDPPSYESPPNYEEVVQTPQNKSIFFQ